MSKIVDHPAATLMREMAAEDAIADTSEARALQETILAAVEAYRTYLDRHGLFYDDEREQLRATALIVTCDMNGEMEIVLKDGAKDRRWRASAPGED
jgi:phage/plasmid primase-like uncharacterized protein